MTEILQGDCVEVMAAMPECSVDAVVCDPPYGLEFMGKEWDSLASGRAAKYAKGGEFAPAPGGSGRSQDKGDYSWFGSAAQRPSHVQRPAKRCTKCGRQAWSGSPCECDEPEWVMDHSPERTAQTWHERWAREAYRVLKPGGHLLAFGGSRTYHRMACAVEDAGFEIRDQIMWLHAQGFPKSLDVGKAFDKAAGAEGKVVGTYSHPDGKPRQWDEHTTKRSGIYSDIKTDDAPNDRRLTAPATDLARRWHGWGTALKPAHEPIVVARKPLIGTVAANVEKHGTGALNVEGCRVGTDWSTDPTRRGWQGGKRPSTGPFDSGDTSAATVPRGGPEQARGRWPANVILDEEAGKMLDGQSGVRTSGARAGGELYKLGRYEGQPGARGLKTGSACEASTGGASRFYYCPKASRKERGEANGHPTVKPVALMRYLVRLVTPPGGTVLDPFLGSGTTALACIEEGFDCIGIEREEEYIEIARARVKHWQEKPAQAELPMAAQAAA